MEYQSQRTAMNASRPPFLDRLCVVPAYQALAFASLIFMILTIVDGLIPQIQMTLFGGQILVTNTLLRLVIVGLLILGCSCRPRIDATGMPIQVWLSCIVFFLGDMAYSILHRGIPLKDSMQQYSDYYLVLLAGVASVVFRGAVSERVMVRCIAGFLILCAIVGLAQYLTHQPLIHTESSDGKFEVHSWAFFDEVRAFSFFTSGLSYGLFSAFCGALSVALMRRSRWQGGIMFVISAFACYSTLTRICYLVFVCACISAFVLTFGKKPKRAALLPLLYFALGILTIVFGLRPTASDSVENLSDTGSLLERVDEWTYYSGVFLESSTGDKFVGPGVVLDKTKNTQPIDNVPLALLLHVGVCGLILVGILLWKMWQFLWLRGLATRQPIMIAALSFWATMTCAGIFNIVFIQMGSVFAIAILCGGESINASEASA